MKAGYVAEIKVKGNFLKLNRARSWIFIFKCFQVIIVIMIKRH